MKPAKGYAELRKGRVSEVNRVYHLVFSTKDRVVVFDDFNKARRLIYFLMQDECMGRTRTLSFVVMPDHIHWLFELKDGSISGAVQRVKSMFSKWLGENVWNRGFYDHAIRADEDLANVARYIVANPLRAGLVKKMGNYPHWDAIWL